MSSFRLKGLARKRAAEILTFEQSQASTMYGAPSRRSRSSCSQNFRSWFDGVAACTIS